MSKSDGRIAPHQTKRCCDARTLYVVQCSALVRGPPSPPVLQRAEQLVKFLIAQRPRACRDGRLHQRIVSKLHKLPPGDRGSSGQVVAAVADTFGYLYSCPRRPPWPSLPSSCRISVPDSATLPVRFTDPQQQGDSGAVPASRALGGDGVKVTGAKLLTSVLADAGVEIVAGIPGHTIFRSRTPYRSSRAFVRCSCGMKPWRRSRRTSISV